MVEHSDYLLVLGPFADAALGDFDCLDILAVVAVLRGELGAAEVALTSSAQLLPGRMQTRT
jgi:hypothetical protein